jgi:hypothetical protein
VIVTDIDGEPPLSSSANIKVVLAIVADPPVLAPITNYTISEGDLLTITNSATDDTVPARTLTYSLGAGTPAKATVDPVTGVFQWRPSPSQAPSTNTISVIVSDNGTPSLSATQQFQVIVRQSSSEFFLALGSTNVLGGSNGFVPVTLQSGLALTNISAILQGPGSSLTNFTLSAVSPEVLSTLVQAIGSNQYSVNLSLNPALSPGDLRTLAQLNFTAAPQLHSEIVPLTFSQLAGIQSDGTAAPKPGVGAGQILLITAEPLLSAALGTNGVHLLTIYGTPGSSLELQYNTNLSVKQWHNVAQTPLTNTSIVLADSNSAPQVFYRAYEFSTNPPAPGLSSPTPSNTVLLLVPQTNWSDAGSSTNQP